MYPCTTKVTVSQLLSLYLRVQSKVTSNEERNPNANWSNTDVFSKRGAFLEAEVKRPASYYWPYQSILKTILLVHCCSFISWIPPSQYSSLIWSKAIIQVLCRTIVSHDWYRVAFFDPIFVYQQYMLPFNLTMSLPDIWIFSSIYNCKVLKA